MHTGDNHRQNYHQSSRRAPKRYDCSREKKTPHTTSFHAILNADFLGSILERIFFATARNKRILLAATFHDHVVINKLARTVGAFEETSAGRRMLLSVHSAFAASASRACGAFVGHLNSLDVCCFRSAKRPPNS